jgi:hypothetical protein
MAGLAKSPPNEAQHCTAADAVTTPGEDNKRGMIFASFDWFFITESCPGRTTLIFLLFIDWPARFLEFTSCDQ